MSNRRVCVLDAGPIIHLDELGAVDLLRTLGELFIPESVAWEAEKHRPGVRAKIDRHIVEDVEGMTSDLTSAVAREELHAGEIAALTWAEKFGADLFVSDDQTAREVAEDLGYESTGTLGVITEASRTAQLDRTEALRLLQAVRSQSSLHVTAAILERAIADLR